VSLRCEVDLARAGGFRLEVALTLPPRGCTTVQGPSGCGKTSLLRCVAGLERGARGHVGLGDVVWQDGRRFVPPHARGIGYVFQDGALFPHLTAAENLAFARRRARRHGRGEPAGLVDLLALGPLLERRPDRLSGGERQRVSLARALVSGPSLLLLDEPLASVDPGARGEILPYLERLIRRLELPVLHVTHDATEAARLADHLVVMRHGRAVAEGPLAAVLTSPPPGLASGLEAAAVLETRVEHRHGDDQLLTLGFCGGQLVVPDSGHAVGEAVRVRVMARDVSLTLAPTAASSILNTVPATVQALWEDGPARMMVRLAAGTTPLLAAVTRRSAHGLGLRPGQAVHAQVKSIALL
jgi:molybdate transport system ATP-binding protein